jgi:hypothetical protein
MRQKYNSINIMLALLVLKKFSNIVDFVYMKKKQDSGGLCIVYLKAVRKLRQMKSLKSLIK